MKISNIHVKNFRLLKDFSVDLEDNLSLILGKNNTGKTSLLKVLEKFLKSNKPSFDFNDFNIDFKEEVKQALASETPSQEDYTKQPLSLSLRIIIKYKDHDNLANLSAVMMDLDPENNTIVLGFDYYLSYLGLTGLKAEFERFCQREIIKEGEKSYTRKDTEHFLNKNQNIYFKSRQTSIEFDNETSRIKEDSFIDLSEKGISIRDILSFKFISAKREVTNKERDKTLSNQTSRIYQKSETSDEQKRVIDDFEDQISETDSILSEIYSSLFQEVIEKVRKFGGVTEGDSMINIASTLQQRNLLDNNTTVMYDHNGAPLPEANNGLGYMNLISMIFEIEILIKEFTRTNNENPADINLLFIEEPEAHTHPQMQYVFIKNIKSILDEGIAQTDGTKKELQTIITTHSSHIVSESNFDDIKYLVKEEELGVTSKNLTDLKNAYGLETEQYDFLKQYLTLSRAEVFFADKAIFIEGDTERILMPTFMRKFDYDQKITSTLNQDDDEPLVSQNISIIEVGAYSHIFEKFIDFTGIKSLILTDIDTTNSGKACPVDEGTEYSNYALTNFYNNCTLEVLRAKKFEDKILSWDSDEELWQKDSNGKLCVAYQINEKESTKTGRSFEEAFIIGNQRFVELNLDTFRSLKNSSEFSDSTKTAYHLAEKCIKKKTHFALDIIYHTNDDYSNWTIPEYINEGLLWLKKK